MCIHDVRAAARALGGAACSRDGIACPGSDHSQADRSPGGRLAPGSPDVFFIFSHAAIRFANAGISPCAARACALAPTPCHAPPKINQHPFLDEEQHAKHMMFARSIWDVAKAAKGIRILLLTAVSCCRILLPPLPLRLLHQHLRCTLRLELRRTEQLLRIVQLLPAALTRRVGLVLEIEGSEIVIGDLERTSAIPQFRWVVPSTFRDGAQAKRL
jgi:hypothetical protein